MPSTASASASSGAESVCATVSGRSLAASTPAARRAAAAVPECPCASASSNCSAPIRFVPRTRASDAASWTACLASAVNRSNTSAPLLGASPPLALPAGVFLVHGLLADAEEERDLLPRPAVPAGVVHLQRLQPLGELAQFARRLQPGRRVGAARRLGESHSLAHAVNLC